MTDIERLNKRIDDLEFQAGHAEEQSLESLNRAVAGEFLLMNLLSTLHEARAIDAKSFIEMIPGAVPSDSNKRLTPPQRVAIADLIRRCDQHLRERHSLH